MASPYHKSPKQMLRASFYRVLLPGIYFQILLFIGNKKCSGNKFQSKHFNIHHNHTRVLVFLSFIFFHPDCTVGFGVSPNHALRLVGYTTGRELHPALKILFNLQDKYNHLFNSCQDFLGIMGCCLFKFLCVTLPHMSICSGNVLVKLERIRFSFSLHKYY